MEFSQFIYVDIISQFSASSISRKVKIPYFPILILVSETENFSTLQSGALGNQVDAFWKHFLVC